MSSKISAAPPMCIQGPMLGPLTIEMKGDRSVRDGAVLRPDSTRKAFLFDRGEWRAPPLMR